MEKEANSRLIINKLLEQSGWQLIDDEHGKATVSVENHIVVDSPGKASTLGDDYEKVSGGFVDYVLYGQDRKPIAVLEAKRKRIHPLDAKEQARDYASKLGVKWVVLSNGSLHYQWNIEEGNPEEITRFPTQESLDSNVRIERDVSSLINETVNSDYIALTQNPIYLQDPRWQSAEGRDQMMRVERLRFLRPYQIEAIKAIQQAVASGKKRFLFEMATGTGKTLTTAAIIKLFIKSQNASRVLFFVDRLELEDQAGRRDLPSYLSPDFTVRVYKDHKDDWQRAEVVVTTIQSIMHKNRFQEIFNPNDFDLIISDEAHRAIGADGASRSVFEYFSGYKLGLTATPKDYLKNLDASKLAETDPRQLERRIQLSTYETFGCSSGDPTFRYTLLNGVKDGYLVNPYVLDCRTKVTTQLLSEQGYSVVNNTDDEGDEEAIFHGNDFEKKFVSDDTNRKFVEIFLAKAQRDPISKEIGKSIIFCVSQNHARKITQLLNEYAHELFPGIYNSDFAMQITSNVNDAQSYTVKFANNNLSGNSRMLDGYKTSKTRVCVTVGMMTTGYDCSDLLNIGLMRPIFSPQDFVQIKGRGTRKHTFSYTQRLHDEQAGEVAEKQNFYLFDFFANCDFFEEDYPYDEVPELPTRTIETTATGGGTTIIDFPPGGDIYGHIRSATDKLQTVNERQIGLEGMKVDVKLSGVLRQKAEDAAKKKADIRQQAHEWWLEFVQKYTISFADNEAINALFNLAVFDEQVLADMHTHEFSKYADKPEIVNLFNVAGRTWIDRVAQFILTKKLLPESCFLC